MKKIWDILKLVGWGILALLAGILNWWVFICIGIIIADLIALISAEFAIVWICIVFVTVIIITLLQIFDI